MNQLDRILQRIEYLPPFPVAVAKAMALLKNPNTTVDEIADIIRFDQAIATNILRLCNSSYIGLRRPISNIREAVVFIGLQHLRRILMITGTRTYFEAKKPGYEARKGELWRHALAVSIISEHIAKMVPGGDRDNVFLASLLHDMGKLVLSEFIEDQYAELAGQLGDDHTSFLDVERKLFGVDHAEIGARILTLWRFPDEVVAAVGKHHTPWHEGDTALDDIVRLSDMVAISIGYGTAVDGLAYHGHADICRKHAISRSMLDMVVESSLEELKKVESDFGIAGEE